jgi:hypothetical protein
MTFRRSVGGEPGNMNEGIKASEQRRRRVVAP